MLDYPEMFLKYQHFERQGIGNERPLAISALNSSTENSARSSPLSLAPPPLSLRPFLLDEGSTSPPKYEAGWVKPRTSRQSWRTKGFSYCRQIWRTGVSADVERKILRLLNGVGNGQRVYATARINRTMISPGTRSNVRRGLHPCKWPLALDTAGALAGKVFHAQYAFRWEPVVERGCPDSNRDPHVQYKCLLTSSCSHCATCPSPGLQLCTSSVAYVRPSSRTPTTWYTQRTCRVIAARWKHVCFRPPTRLLPTPNCPGTSEFAEG